ncbi:MAG: hypothetical protein B7X53_00070 [Hyphomonas sp. 34-62-18]|nr:SUMF1/EgtB/PvdO family nonheme iron enzyme [Hyphomonas sp. 34-62-18]OZB19396.1 MAG: hypothetical protein B7X53_00070 [Hyphomonas sp. 34-62-18]
MGVLFISHSSQDNDQAIKVRDWLRSNGWGEVFLDLDPAHGLAPGQRWQEELKRAGENCAAVVVLVSPNWVASRWCQTEFLVADQLSKRIFPVLIAPTSFDDLPFELKAKFQLADISMPEKETEGFQSLAIGLKRAGLDPKSFDWPPPNEPNRSVYRGLQALDVQDSAIFFGRDAHITRGLDELRRLRDGAPQRILVILGASGAGKSSFLRAGLIARLKRDEENFLVLPIARPERAALSGAQGLNASVSAALGRSTTLNGAADLAQALADLRKPVMERLTRNAEAARETYAAKPPTIILPIDQAEELFDAENTERATFRDMVAGAIAQDGNALIVATIRTDSYEGLQKGWLPDSQAILTLPPISAGSFQQIIEAPARLATPPLTIEPALTQQLLADLSAADALPLLAFTLERLQTQNGQDGKLSLADYRDKDKLNGIEGAIQSAVNAVLGAQPSKDKLALARRLFVPALVQVDQDGVKRRVARRADLPADTHALADQFITQRLLVSDEGKIEVAHEAILRQWPALAGWIAEERSALVTLDGVRAAARDWRARCYEAEYSEKKSRQRPDEGSWLLHRSERLKDAQKIAARSDFAVAVDDDIRAYLTACRRAERRAAAGRLRMQVLAGILALMVLGVGYAYTQRDTLEPLWASWTKYRPYVVPSGTLLSATPGTTFQDCQRGSAGCPVMVVIPRGVFLMGSEQGDRDARPDEMPLHSVEVASFAVSEREITVDEWRSCVSAGACATNSTLQSDGRAPVSLVSWEDARDYADWLSQMTGESYRLLNEPEWEYVARASPEHDVRTRFSWGDDDPSCDFRAANGASFAGCELEGPLPTGSFRSNAFGVYDMHGNVFEWTQDCFRNYATQLADAENPCERVVRGGAWDFQARDLRAAFRYGFDQRVRMRIIGLRVARSLHPD